MKFISDKLKKIKKFSKTDYTSESEYDEPSISNSEDNEPSMDLLDKIILQSKKIKKSKLEVIDEEEVKDWPINKSQEKLENENIKENLLKDEIEDVKIISELDKTLKYILIPDSIIEKSQSEELQVYMISQVARLISIYKINKIFILRDYSYQPKSKNFQPLNFISKVLEYLETPQYLRKSLFPISGDLKKVGWMEPLENPHHFKINDISQYREGITLKRPVKDGEGSWVDIGLRKLCKINVHLNDNIRVTVKVINYDDDKCKYFRGIAVSPLEPFEVLNKYWGYNVLPINTFSSLYDFKLFNNSSNLSILIDCKEGNKLDINNIKNVLKSKTELKSLFFFFTGLNNLNEIISNDELSKIKYSRILNHFDIIINSNSENIGVKKMFTEEQISYYLNIINLWKN